MKGTGRLIGLLVVAGALAIIAAALVKIAPDKSGLWADSVTNFDECVAAGNPVMESYPRQCMDANGNLHVESISSGIREPGAYDGCAIGGCSAQVCTEASEAPYAVTTCEYRDEYACYANAVCERQRNGRCGWTSDEAFNICINDSVMGNDVDVEAVTF